MYYFKFNKKTNSYQVFKKIHNLFRKLCIQLTYVIKQQIFDKELNKNKNHYGIKYENT